MLALLGKLNTRDLLAKKGILTEEDNLCPFCTLQPESLDHILLHCPTSWSIWSKVASDLGIQIDRQASFRQFYAEWMAKRCHNPTRNKLHNAIFFAAVWSLWTLRNKVVFEGQNLDLNELYHKIRWRTALWSRTWKNNPPYSTDTLFRHFTSIPQLFP